jgi:hypothetical protein
LSLYKSPFSTKTFPSLSNIKTPSPADSPVAIAVAGTDTGTIFLAFIPSIPPAVISPAVFSTKTKFPSSPDIADTPDDSDAPDIPDPFNISKEYKSPDELTVRNTIPSKTASAGISSPHGSLRLPNPSPLRSHNTARPGIPAASLLPVMLIQ